MVPALTPVCRTAGKPTIRWGVVYVPNGVVIKHWTPAADGPAFEFTRILKPLEPWRSRLLVISGLTQNRDGQTAKSGAVHGRCATRFLTGAIPRGLGVEGHDFHADVSIDQLLAKELGQVTQLGSLELGMESGEVGAGTCDGGFSCAYAHTIAWRSPTTPLPMEHDPRMVFERMFADSGSTDLRARLGRIQKNRSILDSLKEEVSSFEQRLGPSDGVKLKEYLEAVRDIERRLQKAEQQSARELPAFDQPAGVPSSFEEHARLMFDLQVLAYQSDLTRVITFMIGREFSSRTYPEIGAPSGHHPLSHESSPASQEQLTQINTHHAKQFAYYLEKLSSTPDGDGSLLDHVILYYAAGMAEGNHRPENLPVVLAGGGAGQLRGGLHLRYPGDTPLANLHLAVLQRLGMPMDKIHDSTGALGLS
jgi:hypothetical protein